MLTWAANGSGNEHTISCNSIVGMDSPRAIHSAHREWSSRQMLRTEPMQVQQSKRLMINAQKAETSERMVLRSCTICPPRNEFSHHSGMLGAKSTTPRTGNAYCSISAKATAPSGRISCCQRSLKQLNGGARRTIDLQGRGSFDWSGTMSYWSSSLVLCSTKQYWSTYCVVRSGTLKYGVVL